MRLLAAIHRSSQSEVFSVRLLPQLSRPRVSVLLRGPRAAVVQAVVVVEQSAEVGQGVTAVLQRVQLVSVPGKVDVIARNQHGIMVSLLETNELPVSLERRLQKPLVRVVWQGDVIEELGLTSDCRDQVIHRQTLVAFRRLRNFERFMAKPVA